MSGLRDAEERITVDRLPLYAEDVTAQWLTEILTRRYPGTVVTELTHAERQPGFATKLKLELTYNPTGRDHRLPRFLWLKGGFSEENRLNVEAYIAEAMFFAFWGSDAEINKPRSYYEGLDRSGDQGLILLEDLNQRGARFGSTTMPLSPTTAAQILQLQARYHARWWMSPQLKGLRTYVSRFAAPTFLIRRLIDPTSWRAAVDRSRGNRVPTALKNPATLASLRSALVPRVSRTADVHPRRSSHWELFLRKGWRARCGGLAGVRGRPRPARRQLFSLRSVGRGRQTTS